MHCNVIELVVFHISRVWWISVVLEFDRVPGCVSL